MTDQFWVMVIFQVVTLGLAWGTTWMRMESRISKVETLIASVVKEREACEKRQSKASDVMAEELKDHQSRISHMEGAQERQ